MAQVIDLNNGKGKERPPRGDTPPKAKTTEPPPKPAEKKRTPTDKKLAAELVGLYAMAGVTVKTVGDRRDDAGLAGTGVAIVSQAEVAAEAWLDLADQNPAVKRALKKLVEVSTVGTLVGVHLAMLVPLGVDRGIIPAEVGVMVAAAAAKDKS